MLTSCSSYLTSVGVSLESWHIFLFLCRHFNIRIWLKLPREWKVKTTNQGDQTITCHRLLAEGCGVSGLRLRRCALLLSHVHAVVRTWTAPLTVSELGFSFPRLAGGGNQVSGFSCICPCRAPWVNLLSDIKSRRRRNAGEEQWKPQSCGSLAVLGPLPDQLTSAHFSEPLGFCFSFVQRFSL